QKGLDHGLSLAKQIGGRATILYVSEPVPVFAMGGDFGMAGPAIDFEAYRESGREAAASILGRAKAAADRIGVASETLHVEDAIPAEAIIDTAREKDCNLIIMASHG